MNKNTDVKSAKQVRAKLENLRVEIQAKKDLMDNVTTAMKELENSSKEISHIVTEISDSAFQANLLGLNAALEAAKAGGAGRSFAAAAETRDLAQKITGSAKAIQEIVSKNDESFKKGVPLLNEASEFFTTLKETIDEIETHFH